MPDNKVSFRNAHVRKFKQLSSYIAVKAKILVVFLKNEIKKKNSRGTMDMTRGTMDRTQGHNGHVYI